MLPLFHVHGLFVATHCVLLNGTAMRFHARFDPRRALDDFRDSTVFMGVPTFYARLLAEPGLDRAACARMRLFVSGSAPLLAETHVEFERRTGHRILERYGMTETGMLTSNPLQGERRAAPWVPRWPEWKFAWWTTTTKPRAAGAIGNAGEGGERSPATGAIRRRRGRNSPPTAGSALATWAFSTARDIYPSSAVPRT
jgi:acyl-CoA synthetase (AMP-forming)/AMP-acid ligase II